jgi:hypothetical protein
VCQDKGLAPPSILRSDVVITDDDVEAKYFVFAWDSFFADAWPRVRACCDSCRVGLCLLPHVRDHASAQLVMHPLPTCGG